MERCINGCQRCQIQQIARHRPPPEKPQDDLDMERLWRKSHAMLFSKDNHVSAKDRSTEKTDYQMILVGLRNFSFNSIQYTIKFYFSFSKTRTSILQMSRFVRIGIASGRDSPPVHCCERGTYPITCLAKIVKAVWSVNHMINLLCIFLSRKFGFCGENRQDFRES